jgi:RNA ligase (TIGR02306 family)
MSNTPVEVAYVHAVDPHPNADRLEIARVLGTQFVTQKGNLKVSDLVVYFPPDMLIPEEVAEKLGVVDYLKHSVYPGDIEKTRCRIGAIRLRGTASFGFGIPLTDEKIVEILGDLEPKKGQPVSTQFKAVKYQPPEQFRHGDTIRQPEVFHKYTNIQHYYRNARAIPEGTPVRITEKIHGTNSRLGAVTDNGFEFMCGTHHSRVKRDDTVGRRSLYWEPLTDDMAEMIEFISINGRHDVIVFGEIYGAGIQKMDYARLKKRGYRVFDISVDGEYIGWDDLKAYCDLYEIETVPLLYKGPFYAAMLEELTNGPTTLAAPEAIRCEFKGREGIVITPLEEQYSPVVGGRLILKSVSPDCHEAM